jgi:hypothetical protein
MAVKIKTPEDRDSEIGALSNYCVLFIDLLGQQNNMRGETILKPANREQVEEKARKIIQPIIALHDVAESLIESTKIQASDLDIPDSYFTEDEDKQELLESLAYSNIRWQRWSDGIVYFASLGDEKLKLKVGPAVHMMFFAGILNLFCLAAKMPIRGTIEIGWGTTIKSDLDELYGPVVGKAYELESKVAQYPRIVLGDEFINFIHVFESIEPDDFFSYQNQNYSQRIRERTGVDLDGRLVVDYLNKNFAADMGEEEHSNLKNKALEFILDSIEKFSVEKNATLAGRYNWLLTFFEAERPDA